MKILRIKSLSMNISDTRFMVSDKHKIVAEITSDYCVRSR